MKRAIWVIVLILVVVAVVVYLRSQQPSPIPPPPQPAPAPPQPESDAQAAQQVVVSYLGALYREDYETAYRQLSADSKKKHSFQEFVSQAKKGSTQFALKTAKIVDTQPNQIKITLKMYEDPASCTFVLVREEKAWKIRYSQGLPSFPYP